MWKDFSYYRVDNLTEMKEALCLGYPITLGVRTTDSFRKFRGDIEVVRGESSYSGHAIEVYGYSKERKVFFCVNSWGVRYKISGTMELPFEYVKRYKIDGYGLNLIDN